MLLLDLGSVAELADALDLGSSTARCAGSIPVTPTSAQRDNSAETENSQEKVESRKIRGLEIFWGHQPFITTQFSPCLLGLLSTHHTMQYSRCNNLSLRRE